MDYDIIVTGAGPAAAAFARQAADTGKSILLIDGQTEANRKPCGGLLAPDAQKLLAHFDFVLPKSVLVEPQIFSVKTMDLVTGQVRHYQRCYLNMDRYAFDRLLLRELPPSIRILPGRCIAAERKAGLYEVRVKTAEGEQRLQCRFLIGADGAGSLIRKTFFHRPVKQYVSIQQWFPRQEGTSIKPFYSCIFDAETSESCSWIIYKDDHILYGGAFAPRHCRASFERQKQRVSAFTGLSLEHPDRTEACLLNRPCKMRDFVTGSGGVFLIGEAAGFISPSSFEGISSAIRSGTLLAEAFRRAGRPDEIAALYRRSTLPLRGKLLLKTKKRWFMYTPWVRRLILKSGLDSIQVVPSSGRAEKKE